MKRNTDSDQMTPTKRRSGKTNTNQYCYWTINFVSKQAIRNKKESRLSTRLNEWQVIQFVRYNSSVIKARTGNFYSKNALDLIPWWTKTIKRDWCNMPNSPILQIILGLAFSSGLLSSVTVNRHSASTRML